MIQQRARAAAPKVHHAEVDLHLQPEERCHGLRRSARSALHRHRPPRQEDHDLGQKTVTDGRSTTTAFGYDDRDRLKSRTARGSTATFTYDDDNLGIRTTDAGTSTFTYDEQNPRTSPQSARHRHHVDHL
ncbi:hypothetical protein ACIRP7_26275 [Streptomyces sp. NPDC102270]|uniref:hypothetical protein n=1 Tax=Streptomyces sp. NPDC102270 TaxID=3366150 RepID=UPI00382826FF